jgi:hypothetical protein
LSKTVAETIEVIRRVARNNGVRLHDVFVGRLAEAIVAGCEELPQEATDAEHLRDWQNQQ